MQKDRNSSGEDYFRSGGSAPWWIVGASSLMAGISAYTFTGAAGVAFNVGWTVLAIYVTAFFANLLGMVTGPWFRQLRATTTPEVIQMRFGTKTQQIVAVLLLLQATLVSGLPIYALAAFCTGVFGFNLQLTILAVGLVVCLYATMGGRWAVMSCDFVQGIVLFGITLIIFFFAMKQIGGPISFLQEIKASGLTNEFAFIKPSDGAPFADYSQMWVLALLVFNILAYNSLTSAPRFFSVRDGRAARKAALFAASLSLVGCVVWFVPPMVARLLYSDAVLSADLPSPQEAAYAVFALQVLPKPLLALMIVGMFAATTSSIDSGLNVNSAIIVRDLFPMVRRWMGKAPISLSTEVFAGRIATLCLGVCITAIALFFSTLSAYGIFDLMLKLLGLTGLPILLPFILCLFVRRVPSWAGLATIGFSLMISLGVLIYERFSGSRVPFALLLLGNVTVTIPFFLLTQLFWRSAPPAYRKKVDNFFTLMHTPIRENEIPEEERDGSVGRIVMGKALLILSVLFVVLALFSLGDGGYIYILLLSLAAGLPGVLFYTHGKRQMRDTDRFQNDE